MSQETCKAGRCMLGFDKAGVTYDHVNREPEETYNADTEQVELAKAGVGFKFLTNHSADNHPYRGNVLPIARLAQKYLAGGQYSQVVAVPHPDQSNVYILGGKLKTRKAV